MIRAARLALLVCLAGNLSPVSANVLPRPFQLNRLNRHLHGQVIDHTRNHGVDRRLWSAALQQKRDLYVYVPPGFDPCRRYPLVLVLHGFQQDEVRFVNDIIKPLDRAIASGQLPPCIVAAPDGSVKGIDCLTTTGTFFLNSNLGRFEDFIFHEVYEFLLRHYPIRPEPEAHAVVGISMGGCAAFSKAMKYQDRFKIAVGVFPPLNLRWESCRGRYMDNFDPTCWGWRADYSRGHEVVARFYGVLTIRLRRVVYPLFGKDNESIVPAVILENPIELLDLYDIKPGDVEMYIAYAGKDEFNIDAQVESFLFRARQKGLCVGVGYDPAGKHDVPTALKLLPGMLEWLRPRLAPYSPR